MNETLINNEEKVETISDLELTNSYTDIFNTNTENVVQEVKPEKKKTDVVFLIQVILIVVWLVLTVVVYFFGYDLFEPFINVN